jgi:4'-phosphopantetheinyl transferase
LVTIIRNQNLNWLESPDHYRITSSEVHLWRADICPSGRNTHELHALLNEEEHERASRLQTAEHDRYVLTHVTLRQILSHYLDQEPASIQFARSADNKPILANSEITFNLSYSRNLAMLAIGLKRAIGVDTELIRPTLLIDPIMDRFFTSDETAFINTLPEPTRHEIFYDIWTIKEAFLKATGHGRPGTTGAVAVAMSETPLRLHSASSGETITGWQVTRLAVEQTYSAALVVQGGNAEVKLFRW